MFLKKFIFIQYKYNIKKIFIFLIIFICIYYKYIIKIIILYLELNIILHITEESPTFITSTTLLTRTSKQRKLYFHQCFTLQVNRVI